MFFCLRSFICNIMFDLSFCNAVFLEIGLPKFLDYIIEINEAEQTKIFSITTAYSATRTVTDT